MVRCYDKSAFLMVPMMARYMTIQNATIDLCLSPVLCHFWVIILVQLELPVMNHQQDLTIVDCEDSLLGEFIREKP